MDYAEKRMAFGSPITKLQAIQVRGRLGHLQAVLSFLCCSLVPGFGNTVHFVLSGMNKGVVHILIQTVEMEVLLF